MRVRARTVAASLLAFTPLAAHADSDSDSFTVSATVLEACEVVANDLAFGDYDPTVASHLDAATTLAVTCTRGTGYEVGLDLGNDNGATTAARYMAHGSDTLAYTLYRNAGRTQLWGQNDGVDTLAGVGNGDPQTIDVFGRVPMQQNAPAASYQDTITVTVTW